MILICLHCTEYWGVLGYANFDCVCGSRQWLVRMKADVFALDKIRELYLRLVIYEK